MKPEAIIMEGSFLRITIPLGEETVRNDSLSCSEVGDKKYQKIASLKLLFLP